MQRRIIALAALFIILLLPQQSLVARGCASGAVETLPAALKSARLLCKNEIKWTSSHDSISIQVPRKPRVPLDTALELTVER